MLHRFKRLNGKTQKLALRQLQNPGRGRSRPSPGPATRRRERKEQKRGALPFDFSDPAGKKSLAPGEQRLKRGERRTRSLEELTTSNFSLELDFALQENTIQQYLKNISVHPLLTPEEEVLLGQTIEDGVEAKAALAARDFSKSSEKELNWISAQGDSAFSAFVLANLRLVVWTAKRYYPPEGHTLLDMIQDGNTGLIRSVEKWDWRKGHRFSTYGTWWVRQAIDRGFGTVRHVRLPEHVRLQVNQLRKHAAEFYHEHNRAPTPEEMRQRMKMTPEKYRLVSMHLRQHTSLDAPVGKGKLASKNDGDSTALLDLIKTEANDTPDDLLFTSTLKDDVKTLLANILPERHATVITKRFGLDGGGPCTLQTVGDFLGVTRERVRQMEIQAIERLRDSQQSEGLLEALFQHFVEDEEEEELKKTHTR